MERAAGSQRNRGDSGLKEYLVFRRYYIEDLMEVMNLRASEGWSFKGLTVPAESEYLVIMERDREQ